MVIAPGFDLTGRLLEILQIPRTSNENFDPKEPESHIFKPIEKTKNHDSP